MNILEIFVKDDNDEKIQNELNNFVIKDLIKIIILYTYEIIEVQILIREISHIKTFHIIFNNYYFMLQINNGNYISNVSINNSENIKSFRIHEFFLNKTLCTWSHEEFLEVFCDCHNSKYIRENYHRKSHIKSIRSINEEEYKIYNMDHAIQNELQSFVDSNCEYYIEFESYITIIKNPFELLKNIKILALIYTQLDLY